MATFYFTAQVTVSAHTVVEAETYEEALAAARGRRVVIGGRHSGADEEESFVIEDADGKPENIRPDR